jgi:D-3-phosphoglycerate dehydrogenase
MNVGRPAIFVSESSRFSPDALARLRSAGEVQLADVHSRDELIEGIYATQVLWVRLRHHIDRQVMDAAPHLRVIATATTGLNHIDLEEAQRRGIRVISLRGETDFLRTIRATAEHTVALVLGLIRRLPPAYQHVLNNGWNRDLFVGRELYGKTAGIVGHGRVGRMVAGYLTAFGMRVLVTDPRVQGVGAESNIEFTSLDRLLETCDLVTLHVDLNSQTRGFFGAMQFALMKGGAWFVNTSRGELIDESALLQGLQTKRIAGAAVDVLYDEKSSGMLMNPLVAYARAHDNLLITPHIGGCTLESTEKTENFIAQRIVELLQSQPEAMCTAVIAPKETV